MKRAKIFVVQVVSIGTALSILSPSIVFPQNTIDFERIAEEAIEEEERVIEQQREFDQWSLNHTKRVFNWNHISSVVIFFVIHLIIFLGLYFSYIQFRYSITSKNADKVPSKMKVSHDGIEISSSVIGLLILIVSLAFFYLYLENVYPVDFAPRPQYSQDAPEQ